MEQIPVVTPFKWGKTHQEGFASTVQSDVRIRNEIGNRTLASLVCFLARQYKALSLLAGQRESGSKRVATGTRRLADVQQQLDARRRLPSSSLPTGIEAAHGMVVFMSDALVARIRKIPTVGESQLAVVPIQPSYSRDDIWSHSDVPWEIVFAIETIDGFAWDAANQCNLLSLVADIRECFFGLASEEDTPGGSSDEATRACWRSGIAFLERRFHVLNDRAYGR